jgi:MtN3 and saliva related transmembrane protein
VDPIAIIGFLAGFLTTVAFVPQVAKIWRERSAKDLSLKTFVAFTVGIGLWLAYGILEGRLPLIVWNGISLCLSAAILLMKLRFG